VLKTVRSYTQIKGFRKRVRHTYSANIEGWFRVGGVVDAGPGHKYDTVFPSFPIPPEGLGWLCDAGICGDGETQAQILYYLLTIGYADLGYFGIVTGNIDNKADGNLRAID
jgi:hypothetical protein